MRIIEKTPYGYGMFPRPTPSNRERIESWRRLYRNIPVERQVSPLPNGQPNDHVKTLNGHADEYQIDPPDPLDMYDGDMNPLSYSDLSHGY